MPLLRRLASLLVAFALLLPALAGTRAGVATAHALDEHHADMSEHCATPETDRAPTPPRCPADMPMGCASMVSCAAPAALATRVVTLEMESPTPARRPQAPLTRLHSRVAPPDVPPPRA